MSAIFVPTHQCVIIKKYWIPILNIRWSYNHLLQPSYINNGSLYILEGTTYSTAQQPRASKTASQASGFKYNFLYIPYNLFKKNAKFCEPHAKFFDMSRPAPKDSLQEVFIQSVFILKQRPCYWDSLVAATLKGGLPL